MEINERIFELLSKKNCSQQQFANYIGASYTTISTWKSRGTNPPAEYIPLIANFFSVSTSYILTGTEEPLKTALNEGELRALEYYRRLNIENQDYIKGEMVRLHKEQEKDLKGNNEGHTRGLAK